MPDKIKDTAQAVQGIVEAVPIYEDLLQPTIQELGKGLHTLSKTIHIALAPVSALVWSYDQIRDFTISTLEQKLKNVPKENIIPPDPSIAGPALEALRYTGHKEELREMFSNLLATAMNSDVSSTAHPSFVEVIKQITPDEGKIIKYLGMKNFQPLIHLLRNVPIGDGEANFYRNFSLISEQSDCQFVELTPSYLDNLQRLGIIEIPDGRHLTPIEEKYSPLEIHPRFLKLYDELNELKASPILQRRYFFLTDFGTQFHNACI